MTGIDWAVVLGGIATIAWINWYFFVAGRPSAGAALGPGGVQEVRISVRGGYDPAEVHARAGVPVRMIFDRKESSGCSEEVVLPEFGIRRFLPPHEQTVIEFTPAEPGMYEFTCGMGMLRGRISVRAGDQG